jgi:hypothetical protein
MFHFPISNMMMLMMVVTIAQPPSMMRMVHSFSTTSVSSTNKLQQHRVPPNYDSPRKRQPLFMVPKYVDNKWIPQTKEDLPEAGYDIFGTFLRHGPMPALTRITQPEDYEQAILKFMVQDQCDYISAQGNMDAYLRNPADWSYTRMEDTKRGVAQQRDYVTIQTGEIVLVLVWSGIVFALVGRAIYSATNGVDFVRVSMQFVFAKCRLLCWQFWKSQLVPDNFTFSFYFDTGSTIGALVPSMEVIKLLFYTAVQQIK